MLVSSTNTINLGLPMMFIINFKASFPSFLMASVTTFAVMVTK